MTSVGWPYPAAWPLVWLTPQVLRLRWVATQGVWFGAATDHISAYNRQVPDQMGYFEPISGRESQCSWAQGTIRNGF